MIDWFPIFLKEFNHEVLTEGMNLIQPEDPTGLGMGSVTSSVCNLSRLAFATGSPNEPLDNPVFHILTDREIDRYPADRLLPSLTEFRPEAHQQFRSIGSRVLI